VHLDAGRPNQAEAEAARALEVAGEPMLADAWTAAPAYLAHGRALRALGRGREAERELARAEQRAWRPDPSLVHACVLIHLARIRIELGRLAAAASDLESAREVLSAFADAGALPELFAAARRELAVATASAESAEEHPTAAELAVLRLLATDLSRREIGAELFLSLNTVKTHVRALYRKLGVTSREEVVRRAATLGLLDEPDAAA
jgi:LuxR family maltose regulon positive regulatory protein